MMGEVPVVAARLVALGHGPDGRVGRVRVRGAELEIALDLVPEARAGDVVLVHAGVALAVMDGEREAGGGRED